MRNKVKHLLFILTPVLATILVSCMKSGQPGAWPNSQSNLPTPSTGTHKPAPGVAQGTGDGAGGNTYRGKPLESYVRDIRKTEAYQQYIAPLLSGLKSNSPIYRIINYSVLHKNWYFIPGDLNTLPPEKIASAVQTEQGALQTFTAVWLDSRIVDTMKPRDLARMYLHEMLVGIRLLRFESLTDQCLSFAPKANYCDDMLTKPMGKPTDLNGHDYEEIRRAGVEIFANPPRGRRAWENFLGRHGFSFSEMKFWNRGPLVEFTFANVARDVRTAVATDYVPSHGFNEPTDSTQNTSEPCHVSFEINEAKKEIGVTLWRKSKATISTTYSIGDDTSVTSKSMIDGKVYLPYDLLADESDTSNRHLKWGARRYQTTIWFNSTLDAISAVELREVACVYDYPNSKSSCDWKDVNNGLDYVCAMSNRDPFR